MEMGKEFLALFPFCHQPQLVGPFTCVPSMGAVYSVSKAILKKFKLIEEKLSSPIVVQLVISFLA
jgi:hypothetical protein